jgi:leucyl-tRNA synthetase
MEYKFREIEKKWQQQWINTNAYKVSNVSEKPKFYVLDMFPYPSGAGLHVGHPLGYIASDIYSRFKRLKGFNVLHPMGYDAFGLPAEQYAIEHGVHPAVSTDQNINNFRRQLDNIGFCYDWDREVRTCDPGYYKWTQWIFLQLFNSFYNRKTNKAEKIDVLIASFEAEGNASHAIPNSQFPITSFTAEEWKSFAEKTQQDILMQYRLAYCGYGEVNWCEALGTVLANDEVVNGVSERGGHPVVKKKLRQWYLRITEYADRLLEGLERIDFSESMKEMQTNWIGKSSGAEIEFKVKSENAKDKSLRVYTTRPDTIFGVDFMVVAPEHELVDLIKSNDQATAVDEYIAYVKSRSERERQAEKKISGVFTGAYAVNPFDGREIPIWISEYVLAGYGTGAIMAVPCGDERDFKFAQHFNIPITNIIGKHFNGEDANATKDAIL